MNETTARLLRALENLLAIAPECRVSAVYQSIAAQIIQEAREAVALARGADHV